jgi:flagellar hook-basal body complex protein FliE
MIPIITAVAGVLSALSSISSMSSAPAPDPVDSATSGAQGVSGAQGASFSEALNTAINRLDNAISSASDKAKAFAAGSPDVSLSDVMVSLEQANLALQAAANVRDKIVAAYTNVMNMPV